MLLVDLFVYHIFHAVVLLDWSTEISCIANVKENCQGTESESDFQCWNDRCNKQRSLERYNFFFEFWKCLFRLIMQNVVFKMFLVLFVSGFR